MFGSEKDGGGRPLLRGTLAVVLAVAASAYGMASWLSAGGLERSGLGRLAATMTGIDDPLTTGSIGKSTRLDPCVLVRR